MSPSRSLGVVSLAQLATGVTGMAIALKRRHHYDTPVKRGSPDTVGRDSLFNGTALSAPVTMLVTQVVSASTALRGAPSSADTVLEGLGFTMVAGYLGESLCRRRLLQPSEFDPVETPLIVVALGLSVAMGVLGRRARRARRSSSTTDEYS